MTTPSDMAPEPTFRERFRPQFHFTPRKNWMNDPSGLVYYGGTFHLFHQSNPFVDRTRAGESGFHESFSARYDAPLALNDEPLRLHVFVDRSSVEVFAGDGRVVLSSRVFPDPASDGVSLFAEGGTATLLALDAWELSSTWHPVPS